MVLYPNKLPESERVCSGICNKEAGHKYEELGLSDYRVFGDGETETDNIQISIQ